MASETGTKTTGAALEPGSANYIIEGEDKYLLRKDGSRIGPTDATECEMQLWAYASKLRAEVERLKLENNRLTGEMTTLLGGDGFRCGLIFGNAAPFVGGCGEHVGFADSYRCADCTASFHRECINQHFELDAYVKSLRELNANGAIRSWKEAVSKAEGEVERLTGERYRLREALNVADELIKTDGHTMTCKVTGCTCGRIHGYKIARDNYVSMRAALKASEEKL